MKQLFNLIGEICAAIVFGTVAIFTVFVTIALPIIAIFGVPILLGILIIKLIIKI